MSFSEQLFNVSFHLLYRYIYTKCWCCFVDVKEVRIKQLFQEFR